MPYLIKSKTRELVMRDGSGADDPVFEVGPLGEVAFETLPRGLVVGDNVDCVVQEVATLEGVKRNESLQERRLRLSTETAAARAKADAEKLAAFADEAKAKAEAAMTEAERLAKEEAEQKRQAAAEAEAAQRSAEHGDDEVKTKRKAKLADTVKEK